MNKLKSLSNYFNGLKLFSVRNYGPEISIFLLFAFINLVIGCSSYYKVKTSTTTAPLNEQIKNKSKYFIVHEGTNAWHLKSVSLNDEKKEISGAIEYLPVNHQSYETLNPKLVYHKYKPRFISSNPTIEVHLYIAEHAVEQDSLISIPLAAINKIDIYDKAVGQTITSHVIGTIGTIAAVIVIIGVIAILTKSSCPFAYVNDGHAFKFTGELYGGAIYSSLERDDYMPLPGDKLVKGDYQVKISNELLERQYTNLAELIVVEHPDYSNVLIDKMGKIQTVSNAISPSQAVSDENIDYVPSLLSKDSSNYVFNDENTSNKDLSSLTLSFKKPLNVKTGKLIINAKNSFWLDYIYGKFNEQFGTYFNEFSENQKKVPVQKINQWTRDQGIPLSVYVQTADGWKYADYFNVIGPLASRDMVMSLDLSGTKEDEIKIRLECGFMFWEIDYAAMDFSENIPVKISHVTSSSALDEKGNEVSSLIASSDDKYLIQPEAGNEVIIDYSIPAPENNNIQSLFLHSKGYYEYIRDYRTEPNLLYLSFFRKKGSFARFSKDHYTEFVGDTYLFNHFLTANDGK
ncbi:MAG: hypothetical protein ABI761_12445 [Saprospiraceae bacterium]